MHAPAEAIEELEHAVNELGLKVVVMASYVKRPIKAIEREYPAAAPYAFWLDTYGLDSEYDYDPVWAKCVELKAAPTFHTAGYGWAWRNSISNFMFNHIGHFAASAEGLCRSLFMGGVTRRFPELNFAFLEGGVGWARSLLSDLVGHWEKRNPKAIGNYDPANLDREQLIDLKERYGGPLTRVEGMELWSCSSDDYANLDEWLPCRNPIQGGRPRSVRALLLLRLRGRRPHHGVRFRYPQKSLRRAPQCHLQLGPGTLGCGQHGGSDFRSP